MNFEPLLTTRREFLRTTVLGSALAWTVPSFIAQTFSSLHAEALNSATQTATGKDSPILVIIQLAGGNDGLNTVIPYSNDFYYKARPTLNVPGKNQLTLNDQVALPATMPEFKGLFDAGHLAVINGVGYPNPNRSHFRSTEIWQSASDAEKAESHGWIGRYFDNCCQGADPTVGIAIAGQTPQAFIAEHPTGISLDNPRNYRFVSSSNKMKGAVDNEEYFYRQLNKMDTTHGGEPGVAGGGGGEIEPNAGGSIGAVAGSVSTSGSNLDFLERTAMDAQISSDKIRAILSKAPTQASYPPYGLANNLRMISQLIAAGMTTRVYYVSLGGFDTHTNQAGAHDRLLTELSRSVDAFVADLKAQGNFDRVMLMTFSEFGRRVAQNGSGGTDHGTAAPMFLIGPKLKPGIIGEYPSLDPKNLDQGDLKFSTDFRRVYATLLDKWLKAPSEKILARKFDNLPLGLA